MITTISDVDIVEKINDYNIILVGTNTYCTMSNGLQRDVMLDYPYVQEENMKTKYGDPKKLGTILECSKDGEPTFCLLFITNGYNFRPDLNADYLSYESLAKCLKLINRKYKNKKVACPLLGCSRFDGNGSKEEVMKIFNETITNVDLTIFDYFQKSRAEKLKETREKELAVKAVDREAYYKMVNERKQKANERFKRNGHARY